MPSKQPAKKAAAKRRSIDGPKPAAGKSKTPGPLRPSTPKPAAAARVVAAAPRPAPASATSPRSPAGGPRLGSHLSVAGGLHNAIPATIALNMDSLQIFVKNQRQWTAAPLSTESIEAWHAAVASSSIRPVIAHASYLINLCAPDPANLEKSRAALADELLRCDQLGLAGLVLHPGAAIDQTVEQGVALAARSIDAVFERHPAIRTPLLLESTAGQGRALGRSFEELGAIISAAREPERLGMCIDTCHVFVAGYDIRTVEGYDTMMASADRHVGRKRLKAWHLNDSRGDLGSHLDRHEHIGHGKLGAEAFAHVLNDPRNRDLPLILETAKEPAPDGREWDAVNLEVLRGLFR